jgi:hypothetical protein
MQNTISISDFQSPIAFHPVFGICAILFSTAKYKRIGIRYTQTLRSSSWFHFHNSEYLISYIPFSIQMFPSLSASFISLLIKQLFTPSGSISFAILPVGIVV